MMKRMAEDMNSACAMGPDSMPALRRRVVE
jgi:hypothetical protein